MPPAEADNPKWGVALVVVVWILAVFALALASSRLPVTRSGGWAALHVFGATSPLVPPLYAVVQWITLGAMAFALARVARRRTARSSSAWLAIAVPQLGMLLVVGALAIPYIQVFGRWGVSDFVWGPVAASAFAIAGAYLGARDMAGPVAGTV